MRLNDEARAFLDGHGITAREWVVYWQDGDPEWHGDACGCLDDRCIGHHHSPDEPCECVRALVGDYLASSEEQDGS